MQRRRGSKSAAASSANSHSAMPGDQREVNPLAFPASLEQGRPARRRDLRTINNVGLEAGSDDALPGISEPGRVGGDARARIGRLLSGDALA
jgi:hypothetical protein